MPSEIPVATKEGFDYTQEPQRQNAPKGTEETNVILIRLTYVRHCGLKKSKKSQNSQMTDFSLCSLLCRIKDIFTFYLSQVKVVK